MELHKWIFTLISEYEYKTPPVIVIIYKYIDEAEEALEKNDFRRVESEMDEITYLIQFVEKYLDNMEGKRSEIKAIKIKLNEIMTAANGKKAHEVEKGVHSLKKMMSGLIL